MKKINLIDKKAMYVLEYSSYIIDVSLFELFV